MTDAALKNGMDCSIGQEDNAGIQFEDFITAVAVWGWMRAGDQVPRRPMERA